MNTKNILVGVVVALLVVVVGFAFFGPSKTVEKIVGATPGDESGTECFTKNGLRTCSYSGNCTDQSSHLFAIRTGLGTSTVTGGVYVNNGTTTVGIGVEFATTTAHAASSTGTLAPILGVEFTDSQTRNLVLGKAVASTSSIYFNTGTTTTFVVMPAEANVITGFATGTLAGITNTNNLFTCRYSFEAKQIGQ